MKEKNVYFSSLVLSVRQDLFLKAWPVKLRSCSFSSSQTGARCRPGSSTCGTGGNYAEKKTRVVWLYNHFFNLQLIPQAIQSLTSPRNSRGIANFTNTFPKTISLHRCLSSSVTSRAHTPCWERTTWRGLSSHKHALKRTCQSTRIHGAHVDSAYFRTWFPTSPAERSQYNRYVHVLEQGPCSSSFRLHSETDSPTVPFNLLLLLILVSWETKHKAREWGYVPKVWIQPAPLTFSGLFWTLEELDIWYFKPSFCPDLC